MNTQAAQAWTPARPRRPPPVHQRADHAPPARHGAGARRPDAGPLADHRLRRQGPGADGALHDHPWPFTTRILAGGYCEARPWPSAQAGDELRDGPERANCQWHDAGETLTRAATDLHTVSAIRPDTFTMMQTGKRLRGWGFHPAGRPWMPWQQYLAEAGKAVA